MKNNKIVWMFNHYAVTPEMPDGTRHYDFAKELAFDILELPMIIMDNAARVKPIIIRLLTFEY